MKNTFTKLTDEQIQGLKDVEFKTGWSRSKIIRDAVQEYLTQTKEKKEDEKEDYRLVLHAYNLIEAYNEHYIKEEDSSFTWALQTTLLLLKRRQRIVKADVIQEMINKLEKILKQEEDIK